MLTKTTKECHFKPIKLAKIRKSVNVKCWQGCGNTETQLLLVRDYTSVDILDSDMALLKACIT